MLFAIYREQYKSFENKIAKSREDKAQFIPHKSGLFFVPPNKTFLTQWKVWWGISDMQGIATKWHGSL